MANWEDRKSEPFIQIRHKSIICYSIPVDNYSHKRSEFTQPTYQGKVTTGAAKRIRKTVDLLLQVSPLVWITNPITKRQETHTLSFITLTIPEQEQKPEASFGNKNLLAPWLLLMKRKHSMSTYIWKAEFQKNGMLHYHITTRSWIHHSYIKEGWNNILSQNGLLTKYMQENQGKFPNSTDVHKVYKCKKLENYLQKEISKTQQDKSTTGKIWDCSMNLKKAKHFTHQEPSNLLLLAKEENIFRTDHCTIIRSEEPIKMVNQSIQSKYKQHLKTITI